MNLDFSRWNYTDPAKQKMVDQVKEKIEMSGFHQMRKTANWLDQQTKYLMEQRDKMRETAKASNRLED